MAVIFKAENHIYESLDPSNNITWIGATTLVSHFKKPFDPDKTALKSSQNSRSKWHGIPPEEIKKIWNKETKRAIDLGTWYHEQRELDITNHETIERDGEVLSIIKPIIKDGIKYAPDQKLIQALYPEHFVYLKSAGICGQADRVEVVKNHVHIYDYKTNKEIKTESYRDWEGISQKMLPPFSHIEDCNYQHYALQLSLYMFMIMKHNPWFIPGKLVLHHVTFEENGKDKFGNPVTRLDSEGSPIVKQVIPYELPYYKDEVRQMIKWLHENRDKIKPKKLIA